MCDSCSERAEYKKFGDAIKVFKGDVDIGIVWHVPDDPFPFHCESKFTGNSWACESVFDAMEILRSEYATFSANSS